METARKDMSRALVRPLDTFESSQKFDVLLSALLRNRAYWYVPRKRQFTFYEARIVWRRLSNMEIANFAIIEREQIRRKIQ